MRSPRTLRRAAVGLAIVLGATLATPARPAEAAGMITHAWMADAAIDLVTDDALRTLLEANRDQVLAGATFPDTGYALTNTYGEEAHWQRFHDAYLEQIRSHDECTDFADPDGPCAGMIAHLFGAAAHGMGDEVWDWLYEPNSPDHDEYYLHPDFGSFSSEGGQELQLDIVAVGQHGRPRPVIPALPSIPDLLAAFSASGFSGPNPSEFNLIVVPQVAWDAYNVWIPTHLQPLMEAMPWLSANLVTGPGAVDFAAVAIEGRWMSMWGDLLGDKPDSGISITYPADGQRRIPATGWVRSYQPGSHRDRGGARTRIAATLTDSLPYVPATGGPNPSANLPATSMTLVERDTGTPVPIMAGYPRAVPYNPSAGEHMVDIQPAVDLQPCTWYEAGVTSTLVDSDGNPFVPHTWEFRTGADAAGTRCADDPLVGTENATSGTVTDDQGSPVPGTSVLAYAPADGFVPTAMATTAADGTYRFTDLPLGTYRVAFLPPTGSGLAPQWSGGAPSRTSATLVTIAATSVEVVDATLADAASISGRVTDASGNGVDRVTAYAFTTDNLWVPTASVATAADGTYQLSDLPRDTYYVLFVPEARDVSDPLRGLTPTWYRAAGSRDLATPVVAGGPVTTIDQELQSTTGVSGTVTGSAGAPVAGARVVLYRPTDSWVGTYETTAAADGTFVVAGVAPGSYQVRFVPPAGSGLVPEWFDDQAGRTPATLVTVTEGAITPGVSAGLAST